jgi:hypothetical protein
MWGELLLLKKINGRWIHAMRIDRLQPGIVAPTMDKKPLYENVEKDFPRQPDGSVNWMENPG